MAEKIKYLIKDENTIVLDEDAHKGDYIDLSQESKLDLKTIYKNFNRELQELAKEQAKDLSESEVLKALQPKNDEIAQLKERIKNLVENQQQKIDTAIAKEKEQIATLKQNIAEQQTKLAIAKQDVIDSEEKWTRRYIATKTFGEALENFIYTEFEDLKQKGAFINADFYKDNIVIKSEEELKGTKGDFIFIQNDANNNPILTVSVEVKTELNTLNKKKNKDHFDQLEKNREKKNCEFAVLISELEKTNKVFDGIYKVPGHEKMYVVRPQTFFSLMSMLVDSLHTHKDLLVKLNSRTARIENKEQFKQNLIDFAKSFNISKDKWNTHLDGVETEILKSIQHLNDTLEEIRQCRKALETGKNKVEKLTMRKLLSNCSEDLVFDDEDDEEEK